MATHTGSTIWDIEQSLRRLGPDHYGRYRETHQRVAVMGNALQGLPLHTVYHNPARETVAALLANTDRPGMVSEKLLTHAEQQRLLGALQAVEAALEAADRALPCIRCDAARQRFRIMAAGAGRRPNAGSACLY